MEADAKIKEIGDQIAGLSLLQAKSLCDYLREVHGLEPAGVGVAIIAPGDGPVQNKVADDKPAVVDVVIVKIADTTKKIGVVKAVREATGLSLIESKQKAETPNSVVKAGLPIAEAEAMKAKLEKEGATVELR